MSKENWLKLVVIISDGIRGHVNQSRGVASWLSKHTGAEVLELEIPKLKGVRRWKVRQSAAKFAGAKLSEGNRGSALKEAAAEWLEFAGGTDIAKLLTQRLLERGACGTSGPSMIFVSAGSMPAFYNLALGRIWSCPCVTMMTPSVAGTAPFDFAVVPEHDYQGKAPNVMTTLGAPNLIVREELASLGESLLHSHPPRHERKWGILIGGDSKNFRVTAAWVQKVGGEIFREAERCGADLYITTSRRTSRPAEDALKRMASGCENVRFLLIASADPSNPVPAMLGACDEIFVTGDSVNMVSEAATAGHRAVLLRTERAGTLKKILQNVTRMLVSSGLLPSKALWGAPRFDRAFESFKNKGLLVDFEDWMRDLRRDEKRGRENVDFNEARRAADWILNRMNISSELD